MDRDVDHYYFNMNKIAILTNKILPYRNDFYEKLGQKWDLTVFHFGKFNSPNNYEISKRERFDFFRFYTYDAFKINTLNSFNCIICMYDLSFFMLFRIMSSSLRNKTILWGIGISTSKGLNKKFFFDKIRVMLASRFAGLILYSQEIADYYKIMGFSKKLYAANNSVLLGTKTSVELMCAGEFNFIFVGSLDRRKRIDLFFRAYSKFLQSNNLIQSKIFIIGSGMVRNYLEDLAIELKLLKRVIFIGEVTDHDVLTEYYTKSILSFSINQAGLSVLQSLGNGVPFLSSVDAITGGELFNIKDGVTGFLLKESDDDKKIIEIYELLLKIKNNPSAFVSMRKNCKDHYIENASLKNMIKVFERAINDAKI